MGGLKIPPYLLAPICAWLLAQFLKLCFSRSRFTRTMDVYNLYRSGGMPSAHTAVVISLATAVGVTDGFSSVTFTIALVVASIVIYDAMNVRYIVGEQGILLAKLLASHKDLRGVKAPKVISGHSPMEVLAGAIVGIFVACLILFA